jgi:hypothetical protein
MVCSFVEAQRPRFPSTEPMAPTNLSPGGRAPPPNMVPVYPTAPTSAAQPSTGYGGQVPSAAVPPQNYGAPAPNYGAPPQNYGTPSLNSQMFDPYAMQPNSGLYPQSGSTNPPSIFPGNPFNGSVTPANPSAYGSAAGSGVGGYGYPSPYSGGAPMQTIPTTPGYAPPELSYPSSIYPNSAPPALFPNGMMGGSSGVMPGNFGGFATAVGMPEAFRLIQGPRVRHTFLSGGDGPTELGSDDTDVSVALTWPNFLFSNQPLFIMPSFGLHLWDGPEDSARGLPGSAFDAFLAAGWQTDPNQLWGLELGAATGVFSDFDATSSKSIRVMGSALGKLRLTPTATLKLGAMALDRVKTNVIPAGGILWQPNPFTRMDIFFPSPKVSWFVTTLGTQDVWAYVSGEYGGGSWTIKRADGVEDEMDINDLRLIGGFEWGMPELVRAGRRTAFVEAGYVFEREIVYASDKDRPKELDDAFMFRAGIGY